MKSPVRFGLKYICVETISMAQKRHYPQQRLVPFLRK